METAKSSLIVVVGPTGSGKSELAFSLARDFRAEIINCDSVQVYRGLDIGSAKVSPVQRSLVRHHLIDVVEPEAELTAGAYAQLARISLADITSRGMLPIIAGGTGFYLRSLLDGLSAAAARDVQLRQRLYKVADRRPFSLHRLLQLRDPEAAVRIHPNDHQKIIRAVELSLSNAPLSPRRPLVGYSVLKLGLNPLRAELHRKLNQRAAEMFQDGLLQETQAVIDAGLASSAKSLQSLGYKQAVKALAGEMPLVQAISECQTRTRQYAKRQMTWFRREANIRWLEGFGSSPEVQRAASEIVAGFLEEGERTPVNG